MQRRTNREPIRTRRPEHGRRLYHEMQILRMEQRCPYRQRDAAPGLFQRWYPGRQFRQGCLGVSEEQSRGRISSGAGPLRMQMRVRDQLLRGVILFRWLEKPHGIPQMLPLRRENEEEQLGLRFVLEMRRSAVHARDDDVGLITCRSYTDCSDLWKGSS